MLLTVEDVVVRIRPTVVAEVRSSASRCNFTWVMMSAAHDCRLGIGNTNSLPGLPFPLVPTRRIELLIPVKRVLV